MAAISNEGEGEVEGEGEARQKRVVIPFTAPIYDDQGRLTYLGSDGLRYVVVD